MYRIGKTFTFCAAHHLPLLPLDHKCSRPHGHNYTVTVSLEAPSLDAVGFVLDYGELGMWWEGVKPDLDHQDLNALHLPFSDEPSAERLAQWLHTQFTQWLRRSPGVVAGVMVRVEETPNTFAEYRS